MPSEGRDVCADAAERRGPFFATTDSPLARFDGSDVPAQGEETRLIRLLQGVDYVSSMAKVHGFDVQRTVLVCSWTDDASKCQAVSPFLGRSACQVAAIVDIVDCVAWVVWQGGKLDRIAAVPMHAVAFGAVTAWLARHGGAPLPPAAPRVTNTFLSSGSDQLSCGFPLAREDSLSNARRPSMARERSRRGASAWSLDLRPVSVYK
jgi:hypothetical protein